MPGGGGRDASGKVQLGRREAETVQEEDLGEDGGKRRPKTEKGGGVTERSPHLREGLLLSLSPAQAPPPPMRRLGPETAEPLTAHALQ